MLVSFDGDTGERMGWLGKKCMNYEVPVRYHHRHVQWAIGLLDYESRAE